MNEQFCFGEDYRNAHLAKVDQSEETIKRVVDWINAEKNVLHMAGNKGTGKTYLTAAIYNSLIEKGKNIRIFKELDFFSDLKECISNNWDTTKRIHQICETEYVILDDLGSSVMNAWQKEQLQAFLDIRVSNSLPTIFTTNHDKYDLSKMFHERFISRLFAIKNTILNFRGDDRRQDEKYLNT